MSKFGFDKVDKMLPAVKRQALRIIAEDARKYFFAAFQNEGLEGEARWKEVQRRVFGTPTYLSSSPFRRAQAILTDSNKLNTAVRTMTPTITTNRAVLEVNIPYAAIQNEGTDRIPARPFMIQTAELTKQQLEILKEETGKVWRVAR